MFQRNPQNQHHQGHQITRGLALGTTSVIAAVALGAGAGPAAARQDAGPATSRVGHAGECFLARVGTQYYRCDDNTGNGVSAPGWVPER